MRGEITALICFLLAFLLEMVDIIIVFMIRGTKKVVETPVEEVKSKLFFKSYEKVPVDDKKDKLIQELSSIETSAGKEPKIITPEDYNYLDHPHS
jgi:tRNA G37 N-methylase Trm5